MPCVCIIFSRRANSLRGHPGSMQSSRVIKIIPNWLPNFTWSLFQSVTQSLAHSYIHSSSTHPFICSPTDSTSHPLTDSLTWQTVTDTHPLSPTHPLTHKQVHSTAHPPSGSLTNTFTLPPTHPVAHSLTRFPTVDVFLHAFSAQTGNTQLSPISPAFDHMVQHRDVSIQNSTLQVLPEFTHGLLQPVTPWVGPWTCSPLLVLSCHMQMLTALSASEPAHGWGHVLPLCARVTIANQEIGFQ